MVGDHWDAVFRLLWTMADDVHDAEDLAQETFLRAWKRIATFRPGTNPRT